VGFYESYYATLNFSFDERARAGLARYISELRALGAVASEAPVETEELVAHR